MLVIVGSLSGLNWGELMAVYAEGVEENGQEFYPELPQGQQILRAEQDFYTYLSQEFFRCREECYCVWEENGKYLSALRLHPFEDGLLVEALETRPGYRRMGYANLLMQAVIGRLRPEKLYSHINRSNRASIAVHERCGFRKFLDYARYADGEINTRHDTYLYEA